MNNIILASNSPRRKAFLEQLGLDFSVMAADIDESAKPGEKAYDLVLRLACEKAAAIVAKGYEQDIVIAADTLVVLDDEILGKPDGVAGARAMLQKLSGRYHEVMTGVCIRKGEHIESFTTVSRVLFDVLSDELIDEYLKTKESLDKSGSYAVQGYAAMFVLEVQGSVSSIVGLPLAQTRKILEHFNINFTYRS